MKTLDDIKMLQELEEYLEENSYVRIIKSNGDIIEGKFDSLERGIAAETFLDIKSRKVFDSPEILIKLFILSIKESTRIELGFRDIKGFEPLKQDN